MQKSAQLSDYTVQQLFIYFLFNLGRPLSETLFFRGVQQLQTNLDILKVYNKRVLFITK